MRWRRDNFSKTHITCASKKRWSLLSELCGMSLTVRVEPDCTWNDVKFLTVYLPSVLKMWLLFIVVCKINECFFICPKMESLWDVDRDVSTAVTASLHQAMKSIDFVSLYAASCNGNNMNVVNSALPLTDSFFYSYSGTHIFTSIFSWRPLPCFLRLVLYLYEWRDFVCDFLRTA